MEPVNKDYTSRFYDYLQSTIGDINVDNYCYAGGTNDRHYNYLISQGLTLDDMPSLSDHCACGHAIIHNCFIRHKPTGNFVVLGNCCIKRFIPDSGRTCETCGEPHRNRKNNVCNACRRIKRKRVETQTRIYVQVAYKDKETAKKQGGRWEPLVKSWYFTQRNYHNCTFKPHSETIQAFYREKVSELIL